jgi:DNA-binding LacI/PurR family transcriptional regulator
MSVRKIALEAGVSTATVSRVINSSGIVNDETRKKILRAIDKTGFKPSPRQRKPPSSSSGLKHGNFVMVWTAPSSAVLSQTGQKMMLGVIDTLKSVQARLTIDHIDHSEHLPSWILEGKVDGILLHGPEPSPEICRRLRQFPTVWLLQAGSTSFGDHVQPDHYFAGEMACKHLMEVGCQSVCCISYTPTLLPPLYWQTRALGFRTTAELHRLPCKMIEPPEPAPADMSGKQRLAEKIVADFIKISPRPGGLFVCNNLNVLVHRELLNRGIVPMRDLVYISANDEYLNPPTVGIDIFDRSIGRLAAHALLWRINNPQMPIVTHSIKPRLTIPQQLDSEVKVDPVI